MMAEEAKIEDEAPKEFVPTWIRVTDPKETMPGGNKGGHISYRGIALVDVTKKSVGEKVPMFGQEYTVSHVWREGKAGEEVSYSFKELPLEPAK